MHDLVEAVDGLAAAVRRLVPGELPPVPAPGRPVDACGRQVPRNPLRGTAGVVTLLRAVPGFAGLWERRVPEDYVASACDVATKDEVVVVACPCGLRPALAVGELVECGCGRWLLRLERSVRVWRSSEGGA